MSRAASDQLTTPSRNIYVTQVKQADGTLRPVMSSQALSDQSVRVNHTWQGEIWLGNEERTPGKYRKKYVSAKCTNSGALFLLRLLQSQGNIYQNGGSCLLNYNLCRDIVSWILGVNLNFHHNEVTLINNYTIATTPHPFTHHQKSGIFSRAEMDPAIVVDAAVRGQEDIVLNILRADPSYLLKPAEVENSVGVKSIRTPLQAAIMANDVQLIERMKEHFERIPNGLIIMYEQMLTIYKESLRQYYDKQQAIVDQLTPLQENGTATPDDLAALTLAKTRSACYLQALQNNGNPNYDDPNYLNVIIKAHDQAQEDNAFDFQPYVKAICDIDLNDPLQKQQLDDVIALIDADTDTKTQAAIEKGVSHIERDFTDQHGRTYTREEVQALPFSKLTLLQKMNRLREKLSEHRREEIISNLHHIIKSGELNDHICNEVDANRVVDLSFKKRSIIFSQVYGFAQVTAEEAIRQDLRQGTYYLTRKYPDLRRRHSNFNYMARDYQDGSLVDRSSVVGWGYKFAASFSGGVRAPGREGRVGASYFKTYVEQKQQAFRACYAAGTSMHPQV